MDIVTENEQAVITETGHIHRLERHAIGFSEVFFQSITNMAPSAAIAYDIPLQAALTAAGVAVGFANIIALIACLLIANTVIQFAKKLPSAGGFLTYVSRGLGPRLGFLSTWIFFIYAMVLPGEVTIMWSGITEGIIKQYFHIQISWAIWEIAILSLVAYMSYIGIKRSAKIGLVMGIVEVVVFLALGISMLIKPATPVSFATFLPSSAHAGWTGIFGFGLIYGILNFVGFEGAAPLAEESKEPKKIVPRSVFLSTLVLGIIYIFMSWSTVHGWGFNHLDKLPTDPSPFTALADRVWGGQWWLLIYIAMTNSALACSLAAFNSSTRVLYSAGRIGLFAKSFGKVHPHHLSPHIAVYMVYGFSVVTTMITGLAWGPTTAFGILAVTLTIGAILVYILGSLALPVFYFKEHRSEFHIFKHVVAPIIAVLLLLYVLKNTVLPIPASPMNLPIFANSIWIVVGVVMALRMNKSNLEEAKKLFVS